MHDYNDKHKISSANFTFCTSVNQTKVQGQAPLVDPVPEKVGGQLTPGPRGSAANATNKHKFAGNSL